MNWGDQMNNLTPEQLQQAGLEAVPWETLEDVKLDAWYRWKKYPGIWFRIIMISMERNLISISSGIDITTDDFIEYAEHSTDNGKTWQPCHNIRPIGGRIEHEKLAVGGEVINKEWEGK